jgi:large repetitive protein
LITCAAGNKDGTITATAIGGWSGGYEFQLELGATVLVSWSAVSKFDQLTAGNYTLKVRDTKGCERSTSVLLNNPIPIVFTATPSTTVLTCFGDSNASITINVPSGGQGSNYLYTLNRNSLNPLVSSGPQVANLFTALEAGNYTVTVTDGWGCSTTSNPIVLTQPSLVTANLVVASTQTCTTQTRMTLSATGGTGLYTYSDTPNFATILGSFVSSITFPVPVGTYRYYVKDANGCQSVVSNDITNNPLEPLSVKLDIINAVINCNGQRTGVVVATATGGLGNYAYTLLDDATNTPIPGALQATPGVFTQLAAGNYKVRVVSGDCTTTTQTIGITQPMLPLVSPFKTVPITCNGNGDGKIIVNASGGTGMLKYAISSKMNQFFETNTFDNLKPGGYDVIVQDVL